MYEGGLKSLQKKKKGSTVSAGLYTSKVGGLLSEALKNEMFNIIFLNSHTYPKLPN